MFYNSSGLISMDSNLLRQILFMSSLHLVFYLPSLLQFLPCNSIPMAVNLLSALHLIWLEVHFFYHIFIIQSLTLICSLIHDPCFLSLPVTTIIFLLIPLCTHLSSSYNFLWNAKFLNHMLGLAGCVYVHHSLLKEWQASIYIITMLTKHLTSYFHSLSDCPVTSQELFLRAWPWQQHLHHYHKFKSFHWMFYGYLQFFHPSHWYTCPSSYKYLQVGSVKTPLSLILE